MHRVHGSTLIEALTCVAILAIVSYLSLPNFAHLLSQDKPKQQLQVLQRMLNFARIKAVASQAPITVCPLIKNRCSRKEWHRAITVYIDYQPKGRVNRGDTKLHVFKAALDNDELNYPRHSITFSRFGRLAGLLNGTFVYCTKRKTSLGLSVSITGRSKIKASKKCGN
ncbi:GspH/FimT family pseudopilin [Pseudoalteromonas 'SMAR']|uniref:GspH/FimT family pseudopilin n=1 Tax=Pseudoalteromonas 'SMAR' TaxID=3416908 RepID=UPI003AF23687